MYQKLLVPNFFIHLLVFWNLTEKYILYQVYVAYCEREETYTQYIIYLLNSY